MLDTDPTDTPRSSDEPDAAPAPRKRAPRKATRKASAPASSPVPQPDPAEVASAPAEVGPSAPAVRAPRKRAPRKAAAAPAESATTETPAATPDPVTPDEAPVPARKAARRTRATKATKAAAAAAEAPSPDVSVDAAAPVAAPASAPAEAGTLEAPAGSVAPVFESPAAPAKKTARKRVTKKAAAAAAEQATPPADDDTAESPAPAAMTAPSVLFIAPQDEPAPRRRRVATKAAGAPVTSSTGPDAEPEAGDADLTVAEEPEDETADPDDVREAAIEQATGARRRRRRGRRGRGGAARSEDDTDENADDDDTGDGGDDTSDAAPSDAAPSDAAPSDAAPSDGATDDDDADDTDPAKDDSGDEPSGSSRRRRRRRRSGGGGDDDGTDDPPNTVTHVRERAPRGGGSGGGGDDDGVKGVKGSTRLEAKRQRRRDGRDTTRRRAPILSEAEFLARREAVDRVMAVRQNGDRTQIAVLEDDVLVEHYVTRASSTSYVGNVYLGRVQNVLPSMEAAFIDIGKGRNGVLYAGEVNWDAAGLDGKSRTIEHAMRSGDSVLVQVTKDPIGHKGARLTSQVSLPGRFLVYVPGGGMTGISRRLPDTERHRLKAILKKIVPDEAGVIVRTAAEGASEEDLTHDVERLRAQWETIQKKAEQTKSAPTLVHGEPDLAIRVVRDVFNEDFGKLVVHGDDAWSTISEYLGDIAPDLAARASRHTKDTDLFHDLRVDEQLMKALDRKVWLPSGGSLVIDRTEAMTVVDVNTGKFVGSGGNLEQTVTRNNLEAAEEIVHQLRLRDVGGIVVIDFIDMVLESNRDLVLRRLTECLGRDRTKHQVAEVTSLGLVQMTRKRVGEGLLEAFSERCEHCQGRGLITHTEPVDQNVGSNAGSNGDTEDDRPKGKRRRGGRAAAPEPVETPEELAATDEQRRAASAAIAAIHRAAALEKAEAAAALEATESGIVDRLATGLVAAAIDAEAVLAQDAGTAPDAEPVPETDTAPEPATASQPETAPEATPEPTPIVADNGAVAPAAGRRRRRAANRPAGPPVPTT